jgi:hypothetical protein
MQIAIRKTCGSCVLLTVAWCGFLVGCSSSDLATVRGNVTLDGTPLDQGSIVFEPADGKGPVAGGTIQNGKYLLEGKTAAVPGMKIVRITASRTTGRKIEAGPPAPAGTMVDEVLYVPESYNEKSTLSVQLEAGESSHDFALRLDSGGK